MSAVRHRPAAIALHPLAAAVVKAAAASTDRAQLRPRDHPRIPDSYVYLRPAEVGAAIGRSAGYVFERINRGDLRAVRVDGALRVPLTAALAWIESLVSRKPT